MSDPTTHEESILDPKTDVVPASDEQQDEVFNEPNGDTPKSFDKFAMKTNNKVNELSQSLRDSNKLNSYLMRGMTATEIAEKDPEFAKRLSRQEEYRDVFELHDFDSDVESIVETKVNSKLTEVETERTIKEAISEIVVDGKRLGLSDRKLIKENPTFMRTMKGFMSAGFSPEESAHKAFKEAYPSKASMVETSFLSSPSEVTIQKRETPEDLARKRFSNPKTLPKFLQKRMMKTK